MKRSKEIHAAMRRAHEVASLHITVVDRLVEQMRELHHLDDWMILGEFIDEEPPQNQGSHNIYVAALQIYEGVGMAIFDTEELPAIMPHQRAFEDLGKSRFVPFGELSPPHKILVHSKTGDLLCRLFRRLPLSPPRASYVKCRFSNSQLLVSQYTRGPE